MKCAQIHLRAEQGWRSENGVHVRGAAFSRGPGTDLADFPSVLGEPTTTDGLIEAVKRLNGFYAAVVERENSVFAVVDHTRSIPLFYGQEGGKVYLSDDAYWVRDQLGETEYERLAEIEFSLCGYVTGPDTLHATLKQLQAGEVLHVEAAAGEPVLRPIRYYRRIYGNAWHASVEELCEAHERVLEQATARMLKRANGRCLCIPLSAGRDSRLIAMMLHRAGYDNVQTFTYGRPENNAEANGSHEVAERLGFKWHFVPYSHRQWYDWFRTAERRGFYRLADGLCALPHIQDWPAVWELKKNRLVPEDAIFVPGHAGTRLRSRFLRPGSRVSPDHQIAARLWKSHYRLMNWPTDPPDLRELLKARVLHRAEPNELKTFLDIESAVEKWHWQERNSKYIVNSVRVYDFWRYDWWLPLMDLEVLEFWSRVPVEYRTFRWGGKLLYEAHVDQMWKSLVVGGRQPVQTRVPGLRYRLEQLKSWARLQPWVRFLIHLLKRSGEYDRHAMMWYGIIPREQFKRQYTGKEDFVHFLVQERLGRLIFEETPCAV